MKIQPDAIGEAGLHFFGRMSASISHELKNVLAIIKENSGLLNDYVNMLAKGIPIDPERFQTVANRIDAQTGRADNIIKDLNQFAHTVDSSSKPVDLNQTLALLVALHQRPAAMRQVALEPRPADSAAMITVSPFLLLNTLGLSLSYALKSVPPGKEMTITVFKSESEAGICFGCLKTLADRAADEFPAEHEKSLLAALGAQVKIESGKGRIAITLPRR